MGQVVVNIAGRPYRMACEDGEEDRLTGLARRVDEKISELRAAFGEIGDQRLTVMAAIALADQLDEAEQKLSRAHEELEQASLAREERERLDQSWADMIADGLDRATERLETFARLLNAAGKD